MSETTGNGRDRTSTSGANVEGAVQQAPQQLDYRNVYLAPTDAELVAMSELLTNVHWHAVRSYLERAVAINDRTVTTNWMNPGMATFLSGGSMMLRTLLSYTVDPGAEMRSRQRAEVRMREIQEAGLASIE